ncbi:MAG: helix-turn-helix domain-containing protein [Archangium sp.]
MALAATIYREHAPHPALKAHVRVLWELSGPCDDPSPQKLFPDGAMSLWINFGGMISGGTQTISTNGAALLGEIRRPIEVNSTGNLDIVGVSFWPGSARVFLDAQLPELVNKLVADPPTTIELSGVVSAEPHDRIARLQEALLEAVQPKRAPSDRVLHAFSRLGGDAPDIASLADSLGITTRQLERRFVDELGASPKQMASLLRFRRALAAMQVPRPDFGAIALECGYADQAHLIRDFTKYTGAPPKRFVTTEAPKTRAEWLAEPH